VQSHCDKVCNHPHSALQLSFFAIAAHQWLQIHCKGCWYHLYFDQVATTSSKDHASRNLIVSWHGAFFELVFLPVFFATVFLQNHCSKGAITLPQGCNHSHAWLLATIFLFLQS
jgi:hypothetical protein